MADLTITIVGQDMTIEAAIAALTAARSIDLGLDLRVQLRIEVPPTPLLPNGHHVTTPRKSSPKASRPIVIGTTPLPESDTAPRRSEPETPNGTADPGGGCHVEAG